MPFPLKVSENGGKVSLGKISMEQVFLNIAGRVLLSKPEIDNFLSLFCFLYLLDILWSRNVVFDAKLVVKKKIKTKFVLDRWKQYEKLSLIDKNRISTYEHREKLNSTSDAIVLIIDWGLHEFIVLLKTISMLFCISQSYTTLVLMSLTSISIYCLIFRKAEEDFRIIHKNIHKKLLNVRMMINQRIRMLNFGHTKVSDIEEVMLEQVTLSKLVGLVVICIGIVIITI